MQLFTNNADSTLDGAIVAGTLSLTVATGHGAKFPAPTGGDHFLVTLYEKSGTAEINHEVVKCTARSGDLLTIVRAQESTTARAWSTGTPVELRLTAGSLDGKEAAGAATSAVAAHVALADPHPQYTTPAEAGAAAPVQSVAGKTGAVTLVKADVGLGNVDNTSDAAKPVSTATQTALNAKQALDADLTAIAALTGTTGLLKKTAANTWALDTASGLAVGDVVLTGRALTPPEYLPLRGERYLQASYPALYAELGLVPDGDPGVAIVERTLPNIRGTSQWNSIAYGGGVVMVSVYNGTQAAVSSNNGDTWTTSATLPVGVAQVVYGGGAFLALPVSGGAGAVSFNGGQAWASRATPNGGSVTGFAYGNGVFALVVGYNTVHVTADFGLNWVQIALPIEAGLMTYGNGAFFAIPAQSGGTLAVSENNGQTWSVRSLPYVSNWTGLCYADGKLTLIEYAGAAVSSDGGLTWIVKPLQIPMDEPFLVADGAMIAAVSQYRAQVMISVDVGDTWKTKIFDSSEGTRAIASLGSGVFLAVTPESDQARKITVSTYDPATQFYVPALAAPGGLAHFIKATP